MKLFPALEKAYTHEQLSAPEAQRMAQLIAFGPIVFQVSRLMIKFGILDLLRDNVEGLTAEEITGKTGLSAYAVKVLTEASLSIGTILVDGDRFRLTKTGWFLLTDESTRVNLDFNHDVNYLGMFDLEQALTEGRPAGLSRLGNWPTVYEGLSQLPTEVQKSWFAFDHFYSDHSFRQALDIVFARPVRHLLDVGGNTGRWAMQCVTHDPEVNVTILDLPQQIGLMREATKGKEGADRIDGIGLDLLSDAPFPDVHEWDAIWMSQFLDCFSEEQIVSILSRASRVMSDTTRLYIMETFWDRQRYETAAFCLTQTSVYFTAIANGNSKMYHSDDMARLVGLAGLEVENISDHLGHGHSIMVCKRK